MAKREKQNGASRNAPRGRGATTAKGPAKDRVELFVNGIQIEVSPAVRRACERAKPLADEMPTTQAAAFLNVSRPFLMELIERGELPCRMVGRDRWIPSVALMEYRKQRLQRKKRARTEKGLAEMVRLSQEMGLYDLVGPPPKEQTVTSSPATGR